MANRRSVTSVFYKENSILLITLLLFRSMVTANMPSGRYHRITLRELKDSLVILHGSFPTYLSCAARVSKSGFSVHGYRRDDGRCATFRLNSSHRKRRPDSRWKLYSPVHINDIKGETAMTQERNQNLQKRKSETAITRTPAGTDLVFMTTKGYIAFYDIAKNQALFERQLQYPGAATQLVYSTKYRVLRCVSDGRMRRISPFTMQLTESKRFSGERTLVSFISDGRGGVEVYMRKDTVTISHTSGRSNVFEVKNPLEMHVYQPTRSVFVGSWGDSTLTVTEISYSGRILSKTQIPSTMPGTFLIRSQTSLYVCNERGLFVVTKERNDESNVWQQRCLSVVISHNLIWAVFSHLSNRRQLVLFDRDSYAITKQLDLNLPKHLGGRLKIQVLKQAKIQMPHIRHQYTSKTGTHRRHQHASRRSGFF